VYAQLKKAETAWFSLEKNKFGSDDAFEAIICKIIRYSGFTIVTAKCLTRHLPVDPVQLSNTSQIDDSCYQKTHQPNSIMEEQATTKNKKEQN
jgi:hypothetical protein